jgi:hypothetical protein
MSRFHFPLWVLLACTVFLIPTPRAEAQPSPVAWKRLRQGVGANLLRGGDADSPGVWEAYYRGFSRAVGQGRANSAAFICENSTLAQTSGAVQTVILNQTAPTPLVASGWSRAAGVSGAADAEYSLYIDVTYTDNTFLYGLYTPFAAGTHDWQRGEVRIFPAKPIRSVAMYALFRGHTGRVWFDDLSLAPEGDPRATLLDGVAVAPAPRAARVGRYVPITTRDGLSILYSPVDADVSRVAVGARDVTGKYLPAAANGIPATEQTVESGLMLREARRDSDWLRVQNSQCAALGVAVSSDVRPTPDASAIAVSLRITSLPAFRAQDRALTVLWALPVNARGWAWGSGLRRSVLVPNTGISGAQAEYVDAFSASTGSGRWSLQPFAALSDAQDGISIGIDPNFPTQFRLAYNARAQVLYAAFDVSMVAERPGGATLRFLISRSGPHGLRGALDRWQRAFPTLHAVRARRHGGWMPFTDIATVQNPGDFGFAFHEGDNAIRYDDANGIATFHYTEPSTWWMAMPPTMPRTYENAVALARLIAADPQHEDFESARAALKWGMKGADGRFQMLFRNEPWTNGAVWSLNPAPALPAPSDLSAKWSATEQARLYSPTRGTLDGEYLDSIEGYVTAESDFNRAAFAYTATPPTWDRATLRPVSHKGLLLFERTRAMSTSLHARGKLLMANGTPDRFGFLAPFLDVLGSETNWLPGGRYVPESDELLARRRVMSGAKPFAFLQNTDFVRFGPHVEKYFAHCLFYGFAPGFFSANAASNPYWEDPRLYNRDRALFRKYMPLVQRVSQAGWQPLTQAATSNPQVWMERFGGDLWTVRNAGTSAQATEIRWDNVRLSRAVDLSTGQAWPVSGGIARGIVVAPGATRVLQVR